VSNQNLILESFTNAVQMYLPHPKAHVIIILQIPLA